IVRLRPEMYPVVGADQLCGDANRIARTAHAALENMRDPQGLGDFLERDGLIPEVKRRSPRDDLQILNLREQRDELLRKSVGKVALIPLLAHVEERQYRDGFLVDRP